MGLKVHEDVFKPTDFVVWRSEMEANINLVV